MTTETEHTTPMDSLIADFNLHIKRLKKTPPTSVEEMTKELIFNVYPSMIALAENIAEVDEVIQEVVEQQDSYIRPELAAQIFATIAAGAVLIELTQELMPDLDDLKKKKLADAIKAFEKNAELTAMGVGDAITDPGDDDEDDEDDEDEDDGETDEDEEKTPVEVPQPAVAEKEESTDA